MTVVHSQGISRKGRLPIPLLLALAVTVASLPLMACGQSGSSAERAAASPVKTAIVKLLPRDASVEPPWNGRFVQVNVRTDKPQSLDAVDWRVFVNGMEPKLDKAPSVLPYAPHQAVVAFTFRAPFGDPGTYTFKVVYAPTGGQKVERSWKYRW
jgi:hypothetical protein